LPIGPSWTGCEASPSASSSSGTWERIYFGTDTNAPALLAGALAAMITWEPKRLTVLLAFAVLAMAVALPAGGSALQVELIAYATVGASVVLVTAAARTRMPGLGRRPLVFLGMISYGLYLWHYPLMYLCRMYLGAALLGMLLAIAVASLSYTAWESRWLRRDRPPLLGFSGGSGARARSLAARWWTPAKAED
jgi:peptidoglycan/LPS O-acetylase OafA/YrhL